MDNKKILVIYYSRSGVTKKVGQLISESLNCDIEEIEDTKNRKGIWGFIVSGKDSVFKKETVIKNIEKDPSEYDLVIIGTPVWASNMSCGVRTYINKNKDKLSNVAFFTTLGGGDSSKAFENMKNLCGANPLATLSIRDKDVINDRNSNYIDNFIDELKSKVNNSHS